MTTIKIYDHKNDTDSIEFFESDTSRKSMEMSIRVDGEELEFYISKEDARKLIIFLKEEFAV